MRAVIAGVGVAGTLLLSRLAELSTRDWEGAELYLIDTPASLGRGHAFGSDLEVASINTSLARLEMLSPSFRSFGNWAQSYGAEFMNLDENPLPRSFFGSYLVAVLSRALEILRGRGVRIHFMPGRVNDVRLSDHAASVTVGTDQLPDADLLVLSAGTWLKAPYENLEEYSYVHNPYPLTGCMRQLARHDSVAVLGAGLTAVDVACALDDTPATVHLVSRSGRLPRVQSEEISSASELPILTENAVNELRNKGRLTAESVVSLVEDEMARFGLGLGVLTDWERLDRHWDSPQSDPADLACHHALSQTNHALNTAFGALSRIEREALRQYLGPHWFRYRVRIPLARWAQLRRMIAEGRLVLHGNIDARGTELGAVIDEVGATSVVNATGPSTDLFDGPSVLRQLAADGNIASDHAGRGVSQPDIGYAIRTDGKPHPRLLLMGQSTAGSHFTVSALDVIQRQAQTVATSIASWTARKMPEEAFA